MNTQNLIDTAKMLVADDKGLPAMDESNPTCNKRFAKLDIPQTVEARRAISVQEQEIDLSTALDINVPPAIKPADNNDRNQLKHYHAPRNAPLV